MLLGPAAAGDGTTLADRLELYAEARKICEQRLGSKSLAFQWCARAFEAAPKNEAVRTDLERLAGEADEWGNLAALYEARTAATTDAEERLWLLRRSLRIADSRFYRPQDARKAAEQIITELGFDEEADAALEQHPHPDQGVGRSGQAAARRAPTAPPTPPSASRLLFRIAQLEEERVADAAAATTTWKKILEAEPNNERALRALIRVLRRRARTGRAWSRGCGAIWRRARRTDARSARRCCCASPTFRRSGSTIRRRRSRPTARCCRRTRTRRRRWPASSGCRRAATPTSRRSRG